MRRLLTVCLLSSITTSYGDNTNLFNQAMQVGKNNQVNMNLNQSSTIDSYSQANQFESTVAAKANAGNSGASSLYNNSQGPKGDPNYLYNLGTSTIKDCLNKTDPMCTTFNKYGDNDTQRVLQAYTQGLSLKYWVSTRPDPADSACSYIHRKVPINNTIHNCIAGMKQPNQCFNTITPSFSMRCSSAQAISDRRWRQADPVGNCDYIDVKLSCDASGSYIVLLASEDCSHSGYSSTATTSFMPTIQQQSGVLNLTPTWSGGGDGCGGGIVNLKFNYYCPVNGDCVIDFKAACGNNPIIYANTFNFSSLTTKKYNYQYTKGCTNANKSD